MIAERPVIVVSPCFKRDEFDFVRRHLVKPSANEVWMAADQPIVTRHFRLVAERRAVAAVEFGDLLESEVFEREPRADVERRLIQVGDEQMRFGRIGDGERQPLPRPFRIERPFVMPGAKQPEDLAPEVTGEETVYFIQTPDNRS